MEGFTNSKALDQLSEHRGGVCMGDGQSCPQGHLLLTCLHSYRVEMWSPLLPDILICQ